MKKTLTFACAVFLLLYCFVGCSSPSDSKDDGELWATPPCVYYGNELYDCRTMYQCEIDIEGRTLERLGSVVYTTPASYDLSEDFQTNEPDLNGAEVYRQTNAQTTGLLIVKIGGKYYEIGSGW